jgi:hypothetical protein
VDHQHIGGQITRLRIGNREAYPFEWARPGIYAPVRDAFCPSQGGGSGLDPVEWSSISEFQDSSNSLSELARRPNRHRRVFPGRVFRTGGTGGKRPLVVPPMGGRIQMAGFSKTQRRQTTQMQSPEPSSRSAARSRLYVRPRCTLQNSLLR